MNNPKITRKWAMPSADTFDCLPIGEFVKYYLRKSKFSIDPFARNKRWATITNDLSPLTEAEYHLDAVDFLKMIGARGDRPDLVIFDPPYSPRQVQEVYGGIGVRASTEDTQTARLYKLCRQEINKIVPVGGVVLSFGWNSVGMGKRGWNILEILMVCHGGAHNDTICVAEQKISHQDELFKG